jgi:hypothetical protein
LMVAAGGWLPGEAHPRDITTVRLYIYVVPQRQNTVLQVARISHSIAVPSTAASLPV